MPATYDVSHYLHYLFIYFASWYVNAYQSARTANPWQSRDGSPGLQSSVPFLLLARRSASGFVFITPGSCVFVQTGESRCRWAQG